MIEDDSQDGPDHVEAHRSVGFAISASSKRNAVVSTPYTTVSMLATIEGLLGARPLGFNDANATPMEAAFTTAADLTPHNGVIPGNLCRPPVKPSLVPDCGNANVGQTRALAERHSAGCWTAQTASFGFRGRDRVDPQKCNRVLRHGQMGDRPAPR